MDIATLKRLPLNDLIAVCVKDHRIIWNKVKRSTTELEQKIKDAFESISTKIHVIRGTKIPAETLRKMWNKIHTVYKKKVEDEVCSFPQESSPRGGAAPANDHMFFTRPMILQREPTATDIEQVMVPLKTRKIKHSKKKGRKVVMPPLDRFAHNKAAKAQQMMQSCEQMQSVFEAAQKVIQKTENDKKRSSTYNLILSTFQRVKESKREECFNDILDTISNIQVSSPSELVDLVKNLDEN